MTWDRVLGCPSQRPVINTRLLYIVEHEQKEPPSTPNSFQTIELSSNHYTAALELQNLSKHRIPPITAIMSPNVLSARDTNVQMKPTTSPEKDQPKSLEYHRQVLNSRMNTEQ
jgi:hypothetical protein